MNMIPEEIRAHNARARANRARREALIAKSHAKARRVLREEFDLARRGFRLRSR